MELELDEMFKEGISESVKFETEFGNRVVECIVVLNGLDQQFGSGDRNQVKGFIWFKADSTTVKPKQFCVVRSQYRCLIDSVGVIENGIQKLNVIYAVERYSNSRELDPI